MAYSNLDIYQKKVFTLFQQGHNIFMTGPAGTGKSHMIRLLKRYAETQDKNCQVTALTGCAAILLNCEAKTVHSWAGIGLGKGKLDLIIRRIRDQISLSTRWYKTDILIIDEISMMSKQLFEILDYVGKQIRRNGKPFGGLQLVFSGDFFQLPPVCNDSDSDSGKFCFESDLWKRTFQYNIELKTLYRQQEDLTFSKILNQIRIGRIKKSAVRLLKERIKDYPETDIKPTIILPRKNTVNNINNREHVKLSSVGSKKYVLIIKQPKQATLDKYGISNSTLMNKINLFKQNSKCASQLEFKIGDQVMCICNLSDTIINGSRGVVIKNNENPVVRFINGQEIEMGYHSWKHESIPDLEFKQIPLIYAWALTIHKCQGSTLDLCIMDIGNSIFECGQTYVALSRVKNLQGLYLKAFDHHRIFINSKVKDFYQKLSLEAPSLDEVSSIQDKSYDASSNNNSDSSSKINFKELHEARIARKRICKYY